MMRLTTIITTALFALAAFGIRAADFSVDGPTIELRRIQFCQRCQAALVVTAIPAGAMIQCPRCDLVQSRIPSQHLLTKIFQVCPSCGARLKVADFPAGSHIRCGHCHTLQTVLAEAVWKPDEEAGKGYLPDAPLILPAEIPLPAADGKEGTTENTQALPRNEVRREETPQRAEENKPKAPGDGREMPENVPDAAPAESATPIAEMDALAACLPPGIWDPTTEEEATAETPGIAVEEREGIMPLGYRPVSPAEPAKAAASDPFAADNLWQAAAIVNGEPVYASDLEPDIALALEQARLEMGSLCATARGIRELQRCRIAARERTLRRHIERKVLQQEARRLGLIPSQSEIAERAAQLQAQRGIGAEARALMQDAEDEIIAERFLRRQPPKPPTPADVREYYQKHSREYLQPPRVGLRGLTLFLDREGKRDPRPALEIARQIVADLLGGVEFQDLIRRYSEDGAADEQGVVMFGKSPLVPVDLLGASVREALAEAKPGKVVGPIIVPGAIAFFKVEEMHEAKPLPLAAVANRIQNILREQARQEALAKVIADLRAQATIQLP